MKRKWEISARNIKLISWYRENIVKWSWNWRENIPINVCQSMKGCLEELRKWKAKKKKERKKENSLWESVTSDSILLHYKPLEKWHEEKKNWRRSAAPEASYLKWREERRRSIWNIEEARNLKEMTEEKAAKKWRENVEAAIQYERRRKIEKRRESWKAMLIGWQWSGYRREKYGYRKLKWWNPK